MLGKLQETHETLEIKLFFNIKKSKKVERIISERCIKFLMELYIIGLY